MKHGSLSIPTDRRQGARTQYGALCWRLKDGKPQVLLITSRRSGRWVLPKGWPMDGLSGPEAALTEAWEEAGVRGKVKPDCLGIYGYAKIRDGQSGTLPCIVAVFPVKVRQLAGDWPEAAERRRKWFGLRRAAKAVDEPELRRLIADFDPRKRRRGGGGT